MSSAVTFQNVTKQYKRKDAVQNLSFDIEQGTVVSLLGTNGAGKTTSISMMLGLRKPTAGTVRLFGNDPTVAHHRAHVGAMLQQVNVPQGLSVVQLIDMFRSCYKEPLPTKSLLRIAGLDNEAKKLASKLSGGQRRRLQFALAMAGNPQLLFLDEPTTAMDVTSRRAFWEQLRHFAQSEGRTIVMTTHHLDEADAISDRILLIESGRLIADGSPAELKEKTGLRYVSFVVGARFDAKVLHNIAPATDIEVSGRHIRVRTTDSDSVLRALISGGYDVSDFEVTAGHLEDAFVSLTQNGSEVATGRAM